MPRKQVIQLALSYSKRQVIQEVFFNENYVVLCIAAFLVIRIPRGIEAVRELVRRGHEVRYYSFEMFREKIIDTGAEYIACDEYLMNHRIRKLEACS